MAEEASPAVERAYPRLSKHARLDYRVIADPRSDLARTGLHTASVQNICGGGLRFHCHEPVLPDTYLAVRIELADLGDAVVALGRVTACEPPPLGETHAELTVEFLWTGWADAGAQESMRAYLAGQVAARSAV